LDAYGKFVGGNLETVVSRLLPSDQISTENIDQVKNIYRRRYLESSKSNTKPYPGMEILITKLKTMNCRVAVNSNKGQVLLDQMVEQIFGKDHFDSVFGYLESRPSKPNPAGVDLICAECGCTRQDAIYVGDGKSDIDTAVNAAIPCVLVHWGQGTETDWEDPRVFAHAENADQLDDILMAFLTPNSGVE
jgi:phosphoglycolate phosphatase